MWVAAKGTDVIFLFVMVNSSTESTKATSRSVAEPSVKLTFRVCQTLQTGISKLSFYSRIEQGTDALFCLNF